MANLTVLCFSLFMLTMEEMVVKKKIQKKKL